VFDPDEIPDAKGKMNCPLSDEVSMALNAMRPYPGDPVWESREVDRFHVYRTTNDKLVVMDLVTNEDDLLLDMNRVWKKTLSWGDGTPCTEQWQPKYVSIVRRNTGSSGYRFNEDLWAENAVPHEHRDGIYGLQDDGRWG
jgi:hypothetical protein